MLLAGSCHCGAVRFTVRSSHPYPFNVCYCSICRKTAGGGGYAINLGADHRSLRVEGREHVTRYRARLNGPGEEPRQSSLQRAFCSMCGSALWCWQPEWPDLLHPHASAVDTPLPIPPDRTHLMLDFKAPWVVPAIGPDDRQAPRYPDESIAQWHERHGLVSLE